MLVSRVLFSSWQDKKYWQEPTEGKDSVQSSETSGGGTKYEERLSLNSQLGCETDDDDTLTFQLVPRAGVAQDVSQLENKIQIDEA